MDAFPRFLTLTALYLFVGAVVLTLQYSFMPTVIPHIFGVIPAFIPIALPHIFMLHIFLKTLRGSLAPVYLGVPAAFYLSGVAYAVYADMRAQQWLAERPLVEIRRLVGKDVRHVMLYAGPVNTIISLGDPKGEFRPERIGFELVRLALPDSPNFTTDVGFAFVSPANPDCFHVNPGGWKIGDRCFRSFPIASPTSFIRIGGPPQIRRNIQDKVIEQRPERFVWGEASLSYSNIVLHEGGTQEVIGRIRHAFFRLPSYIALPAGGCSMFRGCEWTLGPLFRTKSVDSRGSTLMNALVQLRGEAK